MRYQYVPYIWLLIASAVITLSLGLYVLVKCRNAKGAVNFILCMVILTLWSSSNALEMSGADLSTKLFWANMQYFSYCYLPVALIALSMEFTGFDRWVKNGKVLWLAVLPTIIVVLIWTDGLHGLIRTNIHLDYGGLFPVIAKDYGPVFYIHALYSHALNILACALLIKSAFFKNSIYQKQTLSLLIGLSLIIFPNILYISGLIPGFDITPVCFGPAGIIVTWGIFRFGLFYVIPVAWATVIRDMDAGVMVLDTQDKVLDINPAFEDIINCTASAASAKHVSDVCAGIPVLIQACTGEPAARTEFAVGAKVYEVFLSPITEKKGSLIGKVAVVYEITEKKRRQQEMQQQQWQLAVNNERERTARDLHDNLGQVLGFINLQAQGIRQELKNAGIDIVSDKLDRLVDVTQSAHTELRTFIRGIRDPEYLEIDFIKALKKDSSDFYLQTGIRVNLMIPDGFTGGEIRPRVRIHILCIIKEALNNITKHAEAENVSILLSLSPKRFYAVVKDDGKGFDASLFRSTGKVKFGLDIMRERAAEIGGKLNVESEKGKGSRITLSVPAEYEADKNETDVG